MKISNVFLSFNSTKQETKKESQIKKDNSTNNNILLYPKGYRPFFGARLHRTPENFYEQEFNKKGMPKTLKDYLYSNYAVNSKKPPAELSKEAFENLLYCENIEDVKEMFPDEPLFQNIKTLETIRPTGGYLFQLRAYEYGNKDVLQSGKDLTVYLLKKIFYESKDLDEINADFEKDRKQNPELERDEGYCNTESYFLHSTLKSIGISLPDKAYWKSLQGNRTDKEYVSYTYTLKNPRKKREVTNPAQRKPIKLSPEVIQKRRDAMINRWISMTPEQRQKQIEKMREAQSNSVLIQYASPIMYIATDKAHLQDKMYEFFKENKNKIGVDAPDDLNNLSSKQAKALQIFWDKHPRLKTYFANCIKSTIREFEEAKEKGDDAINALLHKADKIALENIERVYNRKLSDPENVRELLKDAIEKEIQYFPDTFGKKYMDFVINHDLFEKSLIHTTMMQSLAKTDEERQKYMKLSLDITTSIFKDFKKKNKRDANSATAAMATVLRPFLENFADSIKKNMPQYAIGIYKDADEMLTGGLSCINGILEKYKSLGIYDVIKAHKEEINAAMVEYTEGMSDKQTKDWAKNIIDYMDKIVNKSRNYLLLDNKEIRERCTDRLPKVFKNICRNKDSRRDFYEFIKDYEGLLKYSDNLIAKMFFSGKIDVEKLISNKNFRDYIYESIIDDYLIKKEQEK